MVEFKSQMGINYSITFEFFVNNLSSRASRTSPRLGKQ